MVSAGLGGRRDPLERAGEGGVAGDRVGGPGLAVQRAAAARDVPGASAVAGAGGRLGDGQRGVGGVHGAGLHVVALGVLEGHDLLDGIGRAVGPRAVLDLVGHGRLVLVRDAVAGLLRAGAADLVLGVDDLDSMITRDIFEGVGAVFVEDGGLVVDGHRVEGVAELGGECQSFISALIHGKLAARCQLRCHVFRGAVLHLDGHRVRIDHVGVGELVIFLSLESSRIGIGGAPRVVAGVIAATGTHIFFVRRNARPRQRVDVDPSAPLLVVGLEAERLDLIEAIVKASVLDLEGHHGLVLVGDAVAGVLRAGAADLVLGVDDLDAVAPGHVAEGVGAVGEGGELAVDGHAVEGVALVGGERNRLIGVLFHRHRICRI